MAENQTSVIVTRSPKSQGIGLILSLLFGPLGLFYSSIIGGIVMSIISIPVAIFTMGIGLLIIIPICCVWSLISVSSHNKSLLSGKN